MRTDYIQSAIVPNGFSGTSIQIHLCYDPASLNTLAVWSGGFYRSQVPPAVDAREAAWLIANHPSCKQLR